MVTQAYDRGRREWRWTRGSGVFTMLLALVAFWLPEIHWLPWGGLVGWLLLLAGLAELAFGSKRGTDALAWAMIGSGLITGAAGLLFVFNPFAAYFPVANVILLWLLIRGGFMLLMSVLTGRRRSGWWLALSGIVDVLLGCVMIADLPLTALVVNLFGPTPEIVSRFALILAASFAATGISQIAIALEQRRREAVPAPTD